MDKLLTGPIAQTAFGGLTSDQQDAVVDGLLSQVAKADEEGRKKRIRPQTKEARLEHAKHIVIDIPPLTDQEREVMRSSDFVACNDCREIFPHVQRDDETFWTRDSCPRCKHVLFGAIRFRAQLGLFPNPYLDAIVALFRGKPTLTGGLENEHAIVRSGLLSMQGREIFTDMYAWAIPDEQSINLIAKYGPILEIGAGRGYWASLLAQRGVQVDAFDRHLPPHHYHAQNDHLFHQVKKGGPEKVKLTKFKNHSLFLCWPPYTSNMAYRSLKSFHGKHLIYIGEGSGGCTADNAFHNLIERAWEEVEWLSIPQWGGIHDTLTIYKRK